MISFFLLFFSPLPALRFFPFLGASAPSESDTAPIGPLARPGRTSVVVAISALRFLDSNSSYFAGWAPTPGNRDRAAALRFAATTTSTRRFRVIERGSLGGYSGFWSEKPTADNRDGGKAKWP